MPDPVLFLDIDGVLNDHAMNEAGVCGMKSSCVAALNHILVTADPRLVIISAWRYMVQLGAMRPDGFEYLLQTHGVALQHVERPAGSRLDFTRLDGADSSEPRATQVIEWLVGHQEVDRFLIIDDLDLGYTVAELPYIKTAADVGLTMEQAREAVKRLGGNHGTGTGSS